MAVLSRTVGDHEVGPWRRGDKSGDPAQVLPTALHTVENAEQDLSLEWPTHSHFTQGETEARKG